MTYKNSIKTARETRGLGPRKLRAPLNSVVNARFYENFMLLKDRNWPNSDQDIHAQAIS